MTTTDSNRTKIIEKIRKLREQALGTTNRSEASVFIHKAIELMEKHRIHSSEIHPAPRAVPQPAQCQGHVFDGDDDVASMRLSPNVPHIDVGQILLGAMVGLALTSGNPLIREVAKNFNAAKKQQRPPKLRPAKAAGGRS